MMMIKGQKNDKRTFVIFHTPFIINLYCCFCCCLVLMSCWLHISFWTFVHYHFWCVSYQNQSRDGRQPTSEPEPDRLDHSLIAWSLQILQSCVLSDLTTSLIVLANMHYYGEHTWHWRNAWQAQRRCYKLSKRGYWGTVFKRSFLRTLMWILGSFRWALDRLRKLEWALSILIYTLGGISVENTGYKVYATKNVLFTAVTP